jgi:hypothetical protein
MIQLISRFAGNYGFANRWSKIIDIRKYMKKK